MDEKKLGLTTTVFVSIQIGGHSSEELMRFTKEVEIGDGSIAVQFASYNSKTDNRLLIMPACKMHALVPILVV